jgi:hypothetical protein
MGRVCVVRYMRYRNSYPARTFIDGMPKGHRERFFASAVRFANDGRLPSDAMGHYLDPPYAEIYEFKPGGWRVFGFRHAQNLYLLSGAKKKNPKAQESDYIVAENMRVNFLSNLVPKRTK